MTSVIDINNIKKEIVMFLRNSNIFTIAQRNVTTTTATGTLNSENTILINVSNVKNIRSVVINSVTYIFGKDFIVDFDYNSKCLITLSNTVSGNYSVSYDYGTDKIFADYPRADLSISSFPRISVNTIGETSDDIELSGDTKMLTITFSINVYDTKSDSIDSYIKTIKEKMLANQKGFYYLGYVKRLRVNNLRLYKIYGNDKIMFKSIDYIAMFNFEYA